MLQKRAALIGRAHFIASMANDMAIYPEVVALQAATKESVDGATKPIKAMEKDEMSPKVLINPAYVEFARAVREAEVDLVLGSRIEKTLMEGMGIAHHAIGSSYYFNTLRYLPVPYVGYEGILYLLQELGLGTEDMFHEREAWKRLCYKNI
jgi:nitrogenase molybdenum-iron protein alpha/beta subunit